MCCKDRAVVVQEKHLEWESWDDKQLRQQSPVVWKTLISQKKTASYGIVAGVFELPPGQTLLKHHHAQEEAYYILEGEGKLELDGQTERVTCGTAVFIPGNAKHAITNIGASPLKVLYMFPADSFKDIEYVFPNA